MDYKEACEKNMFPGDEMIDWEMPKIGLKTQPKERFAIFELPVKYGNKGYQVFNGEKWLPLKVKKNK
mgnify:CR=1 FL=1